MRRKDLENFVVDKISKTWIYNGDVYTFLNSNNEINKIKTTSILYITLIFISIIFIGYINANTTRIIYVVVPYILQFFPLVFIIINLFIIIKQKSKSITLRTYKNVFNQYKNSLNILIIFSVICIFSIFVFIFLENHMLFDIIFLIGEIIICILGYLCKLQFNKIKFNVALGVIKGKL